MHFMHYIQFMHITQWLTVCQGHPGLLNLPHPCRKSSAIQVVPWQELNSNIHHHRRRIWNQAERIWQVVILHLIRQTREDHREGKTSEAGRGTYPWLLLVMAAYSCTSNYGIGRTARVLQGPNSHGFPENCVIYIICVKCIVCVINVTCIICTSENQAHYGEQEHSWI